MELRRNNTKLLKANKQIIKQAKSIENQQAIIVNNEKMASLGLMAGGIAHEINNPLCIISLAALTIVKSIKKEETNTEKTLSACNTIDNTVQRIYKVIKGLQSVARDVEGDPATIETINKILEDALGICRTKFANEGIAIAIEGNLEAKIECRPGQISQILLNLLSNSFDAIKLNQEKWIKINIDNKNDLTTISVIDSGKGIPTNIQDTLMDPFFTTKPVGQGTGLGLSISKSLATTNNAELRIDTNCENTKFDLVFTNSVT
jgi:C4-dicarboxylate-specific signal transduction histidine kinase